MTQKERAGQAALQYVQSGMVLGLGSGSTSECFIRALGDALHAGRFRDIRGIPTSIQSERLAAQVGIPLLPLTRSLQIDLAIDGADEIDPALNLVKGLGGALLREKIIEQNSRQFIVIADSSKLVDTLGSRCPVPVEVLPFAEAAQVEFLRSLGAAPEQRMDGNRPYVTDNGHHIYHCTFGPISAPAQLDAHMHARAGIVETGLFLGMAQRAIIAWPDRIEELAPRT